MKIRLAKKILLSRFYYQKHRKQRPDYYDEERRSIVSPSFHDLPDIRRAKVRYYKWLGVYKKKENSHE